MARPVWDDKKWAKVKGHIQDIEQNYNMSNPEIQAKILEIVKKHGEK